MKKCPFCAEEIQAEAVKCRFCGEFLGKPAKSRASRFTLAIYLLMGPIALPRLWANRNYKISTKIVVTAIIAVLTACVCYLIITYFRFLETLTMGAP